MIDLAANYDRVLTNIHDAERRARRIPGSVKLIAVGKLHPAQAIRQLALLGQKKFAENFVQEAISKKLELNDLDLEWHFVGSIQSNKTREIATEFDWVHSVDRLKIMRRLNEHRPAHMPPLNICIQLNLQDEQSKSGLSADEAIRLLDEVADYSRLCVRGFMCIPKPDADVENQRRVFSEVKELLDVANRSGRQLDTLSMGMTDDLPQAIAEGATHVRIGTALFGPRPSKT